MGNDVYTIAILYMWLLPILSKKKRQIYIELTADTNCSFIEAVDELFQQSSADELMEIMSTPLLSAYCLFCFEKKKIFSVFAADAFGSFREAVDELFQHLWLKNA